MTLLLAWSAFDDGKDDPAALYIATDSRISWGNNSTWDSAQKVYCVPDSCEIFGYCGDVMCVTQTLSQIVHLCGLGTFVDIVEPIDRVTLFADLIRNSLATYPKEQIVSGSSIIYVRRFNNVYHIFEIEIAVDADVAFKKLTLARRGKLTESSKGEDRLIRGSGASMLKGKKPADTTYQAFHRFCECIEEGKVASVGGYPQLVTIRRNGDCNVLGISVRGKNYVLGLEVHAPENFSGVTEWKNEDFERWDPRANSRVRGAKRQPRTAQKSDTGKSP